MQEDLVVLLEWMSANGENELFNFSSCDDEVVEIININQDKSLDNVMQTLAKQQNILKNNHENIFLAEVENIRKYSNKADNIEDIIDYVNNLEEYKNHRNLSNNSLFFQGNIANEILIINDFPNENDDLNNEILFGETGEYLQKMLKAINVEKYSLLNVFFWRLAGGRLPIKQEVDICRPFVEKAIAIIKPKIIICTGNYSVSTLIEENKTISNTRGKFYNYTNIYLKDNILITSLYGPSFLMSHVSKKTDAWSDLQLIKQKIE